MLCVWFSSTSSFSSLCCLSSLLSSCLSSWPSTSSSTMWWTNSLCTSADEDLGTLAEYDPLTETIWNRGYGILLGENRGTIASSETLVQFYSPEAALSFPWTPEVAVFKWWDLVGLRGYSLLRHRPIHYVGKDRPDVTFVRHVVDVQKVVAEFRKASERRHDTSFQAYFDKKCA